MAFQRVLSVYDSVNNWVIGILHPKLLSVQIFVICGAPWQGGLGRIRLLLSNIRQHLFDFIGYSIPFQKAD